MPSIIKKSQTKNEKLCFFQMRYLRVCDTLGFAKEDAKPLTPFFGLKDGLQYSITTASVWHGNAEKKLFSLVCIVEHPFSPASNNLSSSTTKHFYY